MGSDACRPVLDSQAGRARRGVAVEMLSAAPVHQATSGNAPRATIDRLAEGPGEPDLRDAVTTFRRRLATTATRHWWLLVPELWVDRSGKLLFFDIHTDWSVSGGPIGGWPLDRIDRFRLLNPQVVLGVRLWW